MSAKVFISRNAIRLAKLSVPVVVFGFPQHIERLYGLGCGIVLCEIGLGIGFCIIYFMLLLVLLLTSSQRESDGKVNDDDRSISNETYFRKEGACSWIPSIALLAALFYLGCIWTGCAYVAMWACLTFIASLIGSAQKELREVIEKADKRLAIAASHEPTE